MSSRSFPLNPKHSNSKFENYKLTSLSSPAVHSSIHPFPSSASRVTQGRVHLGTTLSFNEVQSRIRHDHLGAGWGGWVGWIDENWGVWGAKLDQDLNPIFSQITTLPQPLPSPSSSPPSEYPSLSGSSPTTYFLSDGHGRLYPTLVTPSPTSLTGRLGPAYELTDEQGGLRPFRVEWVGTDGRSAVISAVKRGKGEEGGKIGKEEGWELMGVRVGEEWSEGLMGSEGDDDEDTGMGGIDASSSGDARRLEILWTLEGSDVPIYTHFANNRFLLGSSCTYRLSPSSSFSDPSSLAARSLPSPSSENPPAHLPQLPFTWTQDSTTLTLTIPLPPSTPKSSLSISFRPNTLSIALSGSPCAGFDNRKLWDMIRPDESTWTFDGESSTLTVELEKANAQTGWTYLFLPNSFAPPTSSSSPSSPEEKSLDYPEVPETLSSEARAHIAETIAKFSADPTAGGEQDGAALPGGISSLLREEMDIDELAEEAEENDDGGGGGGEGGRSGKKEVRWTFVDVAGGEGGVKEVKPLGGNEVWVGGAMGWSKMGLGGPAGMPDVLVKHSVDALLFQPPSASPTTTFTHTKTFPALSFVLSSKRDTRFILHTASPPSSLSASSSEKGAAVIAFSTPSSPASSSGGDAFIYYEAKGEKTAPSGVLKFGGGEDEGSLLGVKGVVVDGKEGKKEKVLVGLCEKGLTVVKGLIG